MVKHLHDEVLVFVEQPTLFIQIFVKDIEDRNLKPQHRGPKLKDTIYIGWKWTQDVRSSSTIMVCARKWDKLSIAVFFFRDSDGRWIKGYTKKIGTFNALHAEMSELY